MRKLIYLQAIAFFLILQSCFSHEESESSNLIFKSVLDTILSISPEDIISSYCYYTDSSSIAYYHNGLIVNKNVITKRKSTTNIEKIITENNIYISKIANRQIFNSDSTLLLLDDISGIFYLASNNPLLNSDTLIHKLTNTKFLFFNNAFQPLLYKNGKLFLSCILKDKNLIYPDDRIAIFESSTNVCIDFLHDTIFYYKIPFPKIYYSKANYNFKYPFIYTDSAGNIYYSLSLCDSIITFNVADNSYRFVNIAAKQKPKHFINKPDSIFNIKYSIHSQLRDEGYGLIAFDPYRSFWYRIVTYKYNNLKRKDPNVFYKPWHLIICNQQFDKLDEINFSGEYYPNNFLITPKGLIFFRKMKIDGKSNVLLEMYQYAKK